MPEPALTVRPVGHVIGGPPEPKLDYWGGVHAVIRLDQTVFGPDATTGLAEYSHLEVIFLFHLAEELANAATARHPRGNPAWPKVGVFAQRNMNRPNRLGLSRCALLAVDGLDLHVEGLDAVAGSPVVDIKPWVAGHGPRGPCREPAWSRELMAHYFAPTAEH